MKASFLSSGRDWLRAAEAEAAGISLESILFRPAVLSAGSSHAL